MARNVNPLLKRVDAMLATVELHQISGTDNEAQALIDRSLFNKLSHWDTETSTFTSDYQDQAATYSAREQLILERYSQRCHCEGARDELLRRLDYNQGIAA